MTLKRIILALITLVMFCFSSFAQKQDKDFYIKSFRELSTDLDARLDPRTDQNGRRAALIKVVTTETGFEFDVGVMGIVDVKQEVGEIWVYVPENILKITIKHKNFGVIREFAFGIPIVSAAVYELVLNTPTKATEYIYIPVIDSTTTNKPDSLDYYGHELQQPHWPEDEESRFESSVFILASAGVIPDFSAGIMSGKVIRHKDKKMGGGYYVKARSNFKFQTRFDYECLSDGTRNGEAIWTKPDGSTWKTRYTVTCGGIWHCHKNLNILAGTGYGVKSLIWEDINGDRAKVKDCSFRGLAADLGTMATFGKFAITAGVSTVKFKYFDFEVGIGVIF